MPDRHHEISKREFIKVVELGAIEDQGYRTFMDTQGKIRDWECPYTGEKQAAWLRGYYLAEKKSKQMKKLP